MMTVIIYISRKSGIPDDRKYFFIREMECGNIRLLECRKDKGQSWTEKYMASIYKKLSDMVGCCRDWQLILADDRRDRIEPKELYGSTYFLWELIDTLAGKKKNEMFRAVPPAVFHVISSAEKVCCDMYRDVNEPSEIEHVKSADYLSTLRFFVYYFFDQERELYDQKEIAFFLVIFYFAFCHVNADYYKLSAIYRISIGWSWDKLHDYVMRMKAQYAQIDRIIQDRRPGMAELYQMPVYADHILTARVIQTKPPGGRRALLKRIKNIKEEARKIHQDLLCQAETEFERIRSSIYCHDHNRWEESEIRKVRETKEKYEDALSDLYRNGIMDFKTALDKVQDIQSCLESRRSRDLRLILFNLLKMVLVFAILLTVSGTAGKIFRVLRTYELFFHVLGLTFCVLVIVICAGWRFFPDKERMIMEYDLELIENELDREKKRMDTELNFMAEYRHIYHLHYEMLDREQKKRDQSVKFVEERKLFRDRTEILERIICLDQKADMKERESREEKKIDPQLPRDVWCYPVGWETEETIWTPLNEKIPFPFSFVHTIKIDRL